MKLTCTDAAHYLRLRERQILDLAGAGKIPHRKIGKEYFFDQAELDRWWDYWYPQLPEQTDELEPTDSEPLETIHPAQQDALFSEFESRAVPEGTPCVYIIQSGRYYKIGKTENFARRLGELTRMMPERPKIVHVIPTAGNPATLEATFHRLYSKKQVNGEWFKLSATDIAWLKKINPQTIERMPL